MQVTKNLKLTAAAIVIAMIALSAFAALPASADAGGNGKGKGSGQANENSKVGGSEESDSADATASESSDHSQGNAGTSGDPNEPQPRSNADNNGGGANHEGPYDSTRDGSPSGNGNGDGNATGKPCAGCVGKADNKNPKGQYPNGTDHNNGYECDGNNGIGKTNPAHTGCTPGEEPPCVDDPNTTVDECDEDPPCVDDPNTTVDECDEEEPPCVDDPNTPDDDCDPQEPPCVDDMDTPADECDDDDVLGERLDRPRNPDGDDVLPGFESRPGVKAAVLPFTGGNVFAMAILALALIAAGAVVILGSRRQRATR
jgi:hypothetical protein